MKLDWRQLCVVAEDVNFPGHPGRGLIEARRTLSTSLRDRVPSPVIQAGASLKPATSRS